MTNQRCLVLDYHTSNIKILFYSLLFLFYQIINDVGTAVSLVNIDEFVRATNSSYMLWHFYMTVTGTLYLLWYVDYILVVLHWLFSDWKGGLFCTSVL